ncbi:MAG: NTE family protein [Hyphomicrobiaceae bacterium]
MRKTDKHPSAAPRTALVLAGGGARGAYQAGVLSGLADLGLLAPGRSGLDTFVGSSAGAINSTMMAAHAGDLEAGARELQALWQGVNASDVFRTDVRSVGGTGIRWAWDLTFGGAVGGGAAQSLLDTAPLRDFLNASISFEHIDEQLRSGALHALALSTTDLHTANGVLFLHGQPEIKLWERRRWEVRRTHITAEHVMASSAIPIFFPAVEIGGRYYGDGSVRNTAPLSPAINLGAERILAISVREPTAPIHSHEPVSAPSIAQIAGVLLDAVMLDAIEVDIDHSLRVNNSVQSFRVANGTENFRKVEVFWIQPTENLTAIAAEFTHEIPAVIRYMMRGLGSEESITELASYLLFASGFTTRLVEAGRADVAAASDAFEAFFNQPS